MLIFHIRITILPEHSRILFFNECYTLKCVCILIQKSGLTWFRSIAVRFGLYGMSAKQGVKDIILNEVKKYPMEGRKFRQID